MYCNATLVSWDLSFGPGVAAMGSNSGCGVTGQYSLAEMAGTIRRLLFLYQKKEKESLTIKIRYEVFLLVCIDSTVGLCLVYRRFISKYQ